MTAISATDADEQIARTMKLQAEINKLQAEVRWMPWQIVSAAALAAAALLAAGAALAKLFLG
jgi:hypothetical protein